MRILGIIVCTVIGGIFLNGLLDVVALAGMEALGASEGIKTLGVMVLMVASYVLAGWGSVRWLGKKAGATEAESEQTKTRSRTPAVIGVAVLALVLVIGGVNYLEASAESDAKAFCAASPLGTPMAKVAETAKDTGTKMLRYIQPDEITVGFTGLPPFSRHFCSVAGKAGVVTGTRYYTLD